VKIAPVPSSSARTRAEASSTCWVVFSLPTRAPLKSSRWSKRGGLRCSSKGPASPTLHLRALARPWVNILPAAALSAEGAGRLALLVAYHFRLPSTRFVAPGVPGLQRRPSASTQRTICFLYRSSLIGCALFVGLHQFQPQRLAQLGER